MSSDKEKKTDKFSEDVKAKSEETVGAGIPVPAAVPIMIFIFALGLILGGFFLPLGKRGESKCADNAKGRVAQKGNDKKAAKSGEILRVNLRIPADAPFYGPKDAPVSIVVFDDFQCPWCKKAAEVIHNAIKDHKNDARFVMMNFPLTRIHKSAELAAMAGMEAHQQGKFMELHDKMFAAPRTISKENVLKWAGEVGMNVQNLKAALDSNKHKAAVDKQMAAGKFIGVRGTPTILVNGRKFNMQRDLNKAAKDLSSLIAEELKIIKQKKYPRTKAYAMLTRGGVRNLAGLSGKPNRKADNKKNARKRPPRKVLDPNVPYKVEYTEKDAWKGAKEPLVTIIEFSDYQCPFCGRADETVMKVVDNYKDDVKLVYLHNPLPFHKQALPASMAAVEVLNQKGLDAYWSFHKHLFANRKDINPANLEKWAQEVASVDVTKFKAAMTGQTHLAAIKVQQAMAAKFGARGTPAFFINGYFLSGARPYEQFKTIVDREIAKAKKAIEEKKSTRADYYKYVLSSAQPTAKYIMQAAPERPKRKPRPRLDHTKTYKIWPIEGLPFIGDPKAEVVIAVGFDIQCPFCRRIFPMLQELLNGEKPKDGKPATFTGYKKGVKIVFLHYPLPFHKDAMGAHEAMQEIFVQKGPKGLLAFIEKAYANPKNLKRETLDAAATAIGADMAKFKTAMDKGTHKELIKKTMAEARKIGVMGTPSVFINGKFARGRSVQVYRKLIDGELEAAKKMMTEKKITADKYYEEIMKTATPEAVWIQPKDTGAPGANPAIRRIPRRPGLNGKLPPNRGIIPPVKRKVVAPPTAPMK
ncbi:MAG: thioredoxin domain-containing protein [Deltaproteobacteria bacterium]|nr:thioredoxin domain-containing protein [Deltaproteobacteria bacterium]